MTDRPVLVAIALIVALPLLFATLGGSRIGGVAIGIVLVVGGLAAGLLASRRREGGDPPG